MQILDYETALKNMGNDEEIYEAVLETFIDDTHNLLENIKKAVDENDVEAITRHSHSLKSSARTIGGISLGEIAEKSEHLSSQNKLDNMQSIISEIENEYNKLLCELKARRLI